MWKTFVICVLFSTAYARKEDINVVIDWWNSALFYAVYVRSFLDTDGDGIGDLHGVINKLGFFKSLGVDAIILSPIYKSSLHDFGYDVTDYYYVNPEYGTTEDLENLVRLANEKNIKIVLDFIPNHTSNESEWFVKSVHREEYYADWYIWADGHVSDAGKKKPPNNWISVFNKSAWAYSPVRDQYYLHTFGKEEADLNYRNPVVLEEMKSIMKFWLEKGIAGMRMSAVNYLVEADKDLFAGQYPDEPKSGKLSAGPNDYDYLNHIHTKDHEESYDIVGQFRDVFDSISVRDNMTRVLMVEASSGIKQIAKYYGDSTHYRSHIPVNLLLIEQLTRYSTAPDIKHIIDRWMTYKPLKKPASWMIGNHDTSRVASRFGPGLVDAYNIIVLLLPGIAITYMGEELGMVNGFVSWSETKDELACKTDDPVNFVDVSRDPERTPYQWSSGKNAGFSTSEHPWLPLADRYEGLNWAAQDASLRSHLQIYTTLAALRKRPAFRLGHFESLAINNEVFAFRRWYNDDSYIIVINFGKSYHVVDLTDLDLTFGLLEVETSSLVSSRTRNENLPASAVDLASEEALVLRMLY